LHVVLSQSPKLPNLSGATLKNKQTKKQRQKNKHEKLADGTTSCWHQPFIFMRAWDRQRDKARREWEQRRKKVKYPTLVTKPGKYPSEDTQVRCFSYSGKWIWQSTKIFFIGQR